jgi:hypothetical protein
MRLQRRADLLNSRIHCTLCRAPRLSWIPAGADWVAFECGARFGLNGEDIVCIDPCRARSEVTARLWNDQTKGENGDDMQLPDLRPHAAA